MCRDVDTTIIVSGKSCRVICARRLSGREPSAKFLRELGKTEKENLVKILARFEKLANEGKLNNSQHFKHIKEQIYEVKVGQFRFPCFRYKNDWVITHGFKKKQDKWPPSELERANRIRKEYIELLEGR